MKSKTKTLDLLLWGVVLFWGANYVVGKWGMLGFDPVIFNLMRFLGATPVLFLMLYLLEKDLRVQLRDLPELALLGLVGITVYQTLFMASVKYATATNASLILAASPVFTAIFAKLAGQEKLGRQGWLGSGIAFIGVLLVLLFSSNKLAFGYEVWRGNLYGILASSVWGLYPIVAYRPLQKYSALKAITYSALFGTLFFIVIGIKALLAVSLPNVPMASWGSLLFSIGPVTIFGLVTWYYGISKVGANRVMAYMYAVPAVAVITAFIVLGERLHFLQVIGAVVIFLGINLIRNDKDKQKLGFDSP